MRSLASPRFVVGLACVIFALTSPPSASAQLRAEEVASGFMSPVAVVPDPVTQALLVVQQDGLVRVVQNGVTLSTPFLDLQDEVTQPQRGERGLLGLALDPHDPNRFFVNFTNRTGAGHTVIARFRRSDNPLVANRDSRVDLVWPDGSSFSSFIQQPFENHKGGNLVFGPDGFLYIGLGDGGSRDDPANRAQNPQTLLGKMLRIDVSGDADTRGYRVPSDNPFFSTPGVLPEIWAFGYRNPWRYSFDDLGMGATGALIVGDVGQDAREEIDYEPAGARGRNYGWSIFEGTMPTPGVSGRTPLGPVTAPIADYDRSIGQAVTGGYVYRGTALPPQYRGRYFLGDSGSGRVFSLGLIIDGAGEARVAEYVEHTAELGSTVGLASFGRGLDGELYFTRFNGTVYRIASAGPTPPAPTNLRSEVSGSTATVAWDPGTGGSAATFYQLEVGSQPGLSNLLVSQTPTTSLGASGVASGIYYVRVRAGNGAGLGGASNEIAVAVGCAGLPAAPGGYTSQVGPSFASLSWNAVAGATGYRVEVGSAPGLADLAVFQTPALGLAGAAPPGAYHTRVRAFNACGFGAPSSEREVTVP